MSISAETGEKFGQHCRVEIMGHVVIVGYVTEEALFGTTMLRVDVPEVPGIPAYTRYFGGSAIYSIQPVSEELALVLAARLKSPPVNAYIPELYPQRQEREPLLLTDRAEDEEYDYVTLGGNDGDMGL